MTLSTSLSSDLRRYVGALERHFGDGLVSVVLFGSWARGEARPESDFDVLIVARGVPSNRWNRYDGLRALAREVSGEFAETVAPILLTPEEAERVKRYYLGMLSGHVILKDTGGFFASVLERLRAVRLACPWGGAA